MMLGQQLSRAAAVDPPARPLVRWAAVRTRIAGLEHRPAAPIAEAGE